MRLEFFLHGVNFGPTLTGLEQRIADSGKVGRQGARRGAYYGWSNERQF